jgi:hypothetical protein
VLTPDEAAGSGLILIMRSPTAGYASQDLGLELRLADDREHLGRPHCTGG